MQTLAALFDRSLALHRKGDWAGALEGYRAILASSPGHPQTLALAGEALERLNRLEEAASHYAQANAAAASGPALVAEARVRRALGQAGEAEHCLRQALSLDPRSAEALHALGNLLRYLGRGWEGLPFLEQATRLAPGQPVYWLNRGVAELEARTLPAAVDSLGRAVALDPSSAQAKNVLGVALLESGSLARAEEQFLGAMARDPGFAQAHENLGRLRRMQGRVDEAIEAYRVAISLGASKPSTHSNLLLALHYSSRTTAEACAAEHRRWGQTLEAACAPLPPRPPGGGGARLRVGYVSPDLCHHAVARFIEPVLRHHDRARFSITAYAQTAYPDETTRRLMGYCDFWVNTVPLGDQELARRIRDDGIEVLVDLAGHTAGNRLGVFALKPAPVQATWLGYPDTTGLGRMDYRITDALADPPGASDLLHTERLLRLPAPFICYAPTAEAVQVGELPALRRGQVTFGCFNNLSKWDPVVLGWWSQVLGSVPGSRLLLKARGLADEGVRARILSVFNAAGIDPGRLALSGDEVSDADQLALYQEVDVALDAFPYHGTTTTCEALWMGVPVVTVAGGSHVSRVGVSLLNAIGAGEWVAADGAGYVARARQLASDLRALASVRSGLRRRLETSALMDGAAFTKTLEAAFERMAAQKAGLG
jgi:protein O-GlcNAc transferase